MWVVLHFHHLRLRPRPYHLVQALQQLPPRLRPRPWATVKATRRNSTHIHDQMDEATGLRRPARHYPWLMAITQLLPSHSTRLGNPKSPKIIDTDHSRGIYPAAPELLGAARLAFCKPHLCVRVRQRYPFLQRVLLIIEYCELASERASD